MVSPWVVSARAPGRHAITLAVIMELPTSITALQCRKLSAKCAKAVGEIAGKREADTLGSEFE